MSRTILVPVALAAGLTTLVAHAQEAPHGLRPAELGAAFATRTQADADVTEAAVDPATTASVPRGDRPRLVARARSGGGVPADDARSAAPARPKAAAPRFAKSPYAPIIARYASDYGVPLDLAHAVVEIESNFRPEARGRAGEIGLMQIKPATARMMGYSGSARGLHDPETNIRYGMKYLAMAHELGGGTTCGTVLKYNAGHAARRMNGVSAAYCAKVRSRIGG